MDTKLGYMSLLLEVHGAEIAQGRVPAHGIVEAFDVIEHVLPCLIARAVGLRAIRSVFSEEKKLSIAALSQTLPDRLIEQVTPLSAISRWNCSLVYWLPWSE